MSTTLVASPIVFSGSGTQTFDLTGATSVVNGDITINKTGGEVDLLSALVMDAASQDLTITQGTFDLSGQNLTVSGSGGTFVVEDGGNLQLQGGETLSRILNLKGGSTVTYDGTGSYSRLAATSTYQNLAFTGSGSWATSTPLTVNENFTQTAGTFTPSATTTFASASSSIITASAGTAFSNIKVNKTATSTFLGSNLAPTGNLDLAAGTLDATASSCSAASCNITLAGNWIKTGGTFTPQTGTVTLNGTNQTITGSNTFYNLVKTVASAATLTFGAGDTQTIGGTWTAQGAAGNLLSLRSTVTDSQWLIDPQGTRTIAYLDVKDSNNTNGTAVNARGTNSVSSGNNTNWNFNTTPTDPSSLGPAGLVSGSWGADNTPTLTFTTADGDSDTVQYQIQIDDTAGFGSPVVDYTSALAIAGSSSFTVGQAAGSGSYTSGSSGQTLDNGSYYWRVRTGDSSFATSSYATANGGAVAFQVDATAPITGVVLLSATTTTSFTASVSGASDAVSGLTATPYLFYESSLASSSRATSDTSWLFAPLTPNTESTFTVGVTDMAGNTATTSSVSGYTLAEAPASASASADSSTQITVVWSAGNNPAGTEYYVSNNTAGTNSGWITTSSWVNSGLGAATSYSYTIKARNGDGIETSTESANATTQTATSDGGGGHSSSGGGGFVDLFGSSATQSLLIGPVSAVQGSVVLLMIQARTFLQIPYTWGGEVVVVSVTGANTAFPQVVDNGDGTYTAQYLAQTAGTDIVTATLGGKTVGHDTDGTDNGMLILTITAPRVPPGQAKNPATPANPPVKKGVNNDESSGSTRPNQHQTLPPSEAIITFEYGMMESCFRAFTWRGSSGSVSVYRTIGTGHETRIAKLNPKAFWYIDVDRIVDSDLTYRLAFASGAKTVVFPMTQVNKCYNSTPSTPPNTGTTTTNTSVVTASSTTTVIEEDIDGDGNNEQLIGGIFQDTDGSSAALAVAGGGILIDTDDNDTPDVYWREPGVLSRVIAAGDRLYIPGSTLTNIHSYKKFGASSYTVLLTKALGGNIALAISATDLDELSQESFFLSALLGPLLGLLLLIIIGLVPFFLRRWLRRRNVVQM